MPDASSFLSFYTTQSDSFGWRQNVAYVASDNEYHNTAWTQDGAQLDVHEIPILLQSAWTNSVGYAVVEVENQAALQTGRGYNFAVLDQSTGELIETAHLDTYADGAAVGQMIEFLAAIPNGQIVLGAVSDEGFSRMTDEAFQALESIGSARIRDLEYRSMWAIIGRKGAASGSVIEGIAPFQADGSVVLKDTLSVLYEQGHMISERIGPAFGWKSASFDVTHQDSSDFDVSVYGQRSAIGDTVLLVSHFKNGRIDLSTIDAQEFPFLTLVAHFSTQNGSASSRLISWDVYYDAAADVALSQQLFTQSADTVLVGQSVTFYLDLYNIGLNKVREVELLFEQVSSVSGRNTIGEIVVDSIATDRFVPVQMKWESGAIPGLKKIYITADPQQKIAELSEANNGISTQVYVHADTLEPSLQLTFDERTIYDGDLVSNHPLIVTRVFDNNPTPLTDTTSVNLYLDGVRMSFAQAGLISIHSSDEKDVRGVIIFQPTLEDGVHELIVEIDDFSHNSVSTSITFFVESDLAIKNALNYPNPFAQDTEFRFSLSQGAEIEIKIFTVAGRLIHTIDAGSFPIGYTKIYWDGRDDAGDELANGVYIYKMSAKTEEESVNQIGKVIVMR